MDTEGLDLLEALAQLIDLLARALPSAIGSLVGVFIAFWLNRRNLTQMNQERANTYLKGLTNEISEAIELLKPDKEQHHTLQLLPIDLWHSAVNSGDVALFPYETREDLRKAYFSIMKCNYEFTRTIGIGDKFRAEADTAEKRERIHLAWLSETAQADYMSGSTLSYLLSLSEKEWFIEASKYEPD